MASGSNDRREPRRSTKMPSLRAYVAALAGERKRRYAALRRAILTCTPGVVESMRYRMPTFEKGDAWVAMASQKRHLAVYFCSAELIAGVRAHHPELDCGVGCVRIRDHQHVPMYELEQAFARALTPASTQ